MIFAPYFNPSLVSYCDIECLLQLHQFAEADTRELSIELSLLLPNGWLGLSALNCFEAEY
jgi:hypothetical protein